MRVNLTNGWQKTNALRIIATDKAGNNVNTWIYPVKTPADVASELVDISPENPISFIEDSGCFHVNVGNLEYLFDKQNGLLISAKRNDTIVPISGGPVFVSSDKRVKSVIALKVYKAIFLLLILQACNTVEKKSKPNLLFI